MGFILVLLTDNCIFLVSKVVGTFCFKFTKCGVAKICKYQTNYKRPVRQHWEHVYSWNQIACLPFCCRDTTQFDGLRIYVTNIGSSKVYPSRFSTAPLFSNEALKKSTRRVSFVDFLKRGKNMKKENNKSFQLMTRISTWSI